MEETFTVEVELLVIHLIRNKSSVLVVMLPSSTYYAEYPELKDLEF